jgi:hypothetical protein
MKTSKEIKYLDQEEQDLDKALKNIDVSKLSTPDSDTQNQFKAAAANFIKKDLKDLA